MPESLLILPTYNEAGNLERLILELQDERLGVDILVIDDNSPDGTGILAERLSKHAPMIVVHRGSKGGLGSAHKLGLQYALEHGYRLAITMDTDFAHSPCDLREMLSLGSSADVVVASRYAPGGSFHKLGILRPIISWAIHWLATWLLQLPYDCAGGFRIYRTRVLGAIDLDSIRSVGHTFLIEILFAIKRKGFSIQEFPVAIQPRRAGRSKVSWLELGQETIACLRFFCRASTLRFG